MCLNFSAHFDFIQNYIYIYIISKKLYNHKLLFQDTLVHILFIINVNGINIIDICFNK